MSSDDWEQELETIEAAKKVDEAPIVKTPVVKKKDVKPVQYEMPEVDLSKLSGKTLKAFKKLRIGEEKLFEFEGSLRAPICCILGHVDTGKTKILDAIRQSNVQGGEAGGITQQIGATFFPKYSLAEACTKVNPKFEVELPGLLIIDTPGHESFNNLRSRGTSLCDIAILVVDIMHGLEPQTIESLQLLKDKRAPFLIALNKVDRLYDWIPNNWMPFKKSYDKQKKYVQEDFDHRWNQVWLQLSEHGINSELWWMNKDVKSTVSVVPTSAHTREGVADLLFMITGLTQKKMAKSLTYKDDFQCTVLEVKSVEGYGCTIDVILINGTLHENDEIVVCGLRKPIKTSVKCILTPRPLKEIRVKGDYIHHKSIRAAMGIKIVGADLDECVAGTPVYRVDATSDVEQLKKDVQQDLSDIFNDVSNSGQGVYVQASTLGSLEALLHFLKASEIPVFQVALGTVQKIDVKKAGSMREQGLPQYAVILAFDVNISKEAENEARLMEVTIFSANIIYHLFDKFNKHLEDEKRRVKQEMMKKAVFPCELKIIPGNIFRNKDPIVCGVTVERGTLRTGTPLYVPKVAKNLTKSKALGKVESIEHNGTRVEKAGKGLSVSIKINSDRNIQAGRDFEESAPIISHMTYDGKACTLKYYTDELDKDELNLIEELYDIVEDTVNDED